MSLISSSTSRYNLAGAWRPELPRAPSHARRDRSPRPDRRLRHRRAQPASRQLRRDGTTGDLADHSPSQRTLRLTPAPLSRFGAGVRRLVWAFQRLKRSAPRGRLTAQAALQRCARSRSRAGQCGPPRSATAVRATTTPRWRRHSHRERLPAPSCPRSRARTNASRALWTSSCFIRTEARP